MNETVYINNRGEFTLNHLEELRKQMNTPEFVESAKKYFEEYFGRIDKNKEKVSSKEYIDWVYNYVSENKYVSDESTSYTYESINEENTKLLSAFLDYVEELAKQQRVLVTSDEECKFDSEQVVVKIKDKYFDIFRMYGQGSFTSINLLDREPNYAFVKIST